MNNDRTMLKAANAFWTPDVVMDNILRNGIVILDPEVKHLVTELDRRFMQMWAKVDFEKNHDVPQYPSAIERIRSTPVREEPYVKPTPQLQRGDIIMLTKEHMVYASIPEHFIYSNRRGSWELTNSNVQLVGNFEYLQGKYIVISTSSKGGGTGHGPHDVYPDGWNVVCQSECGAHEVSFYQSGCFTAMITNILPIGKATVKLVIEQ